MAGLSRAVGEVTRLNMLWRILFDTMYVCMFIVTQKVHVFFSFFLSFFGVVISFQYCPAAAGTR